MTIEDKIALVIEESNRKLLKDIDERVEKAVVKIRQSYADRFLPDYLTIKQAAILLRCNKRQLEEILEVNNIKKDEICGRIYVRRDSITNLL